MKESDIIHENGVFWVCRENASAFTVYRVGATHSVADSSYTHADLAMVRCDYLAARESGSTSSEATRAAMAALRARVKGGAA